MKKLGFGMMRLPILDKEDQTSFDVAQVERMVDRFIEEGFTYFDTAYMYHKNQSEIMVREALVKRHPRESFLLADKMPVMFVEKKEDLERFFNEQLEKTGAGYFDYYLLHSLSASKLKLVEDLDIFGFAMEKKREGKIKHVGFSFHDTADVLEEILTKHPEAEFVQLQINYLDWEHRSVQSGKCYEVARKHGKDIVIMEPVKGGTLANIPAEAEKLFKEHNENASPASWAVRYAAGLDGVMMVLSGMSNLEQMEDNMSYMKDFRPLSEEEIAIIDKAKDIILQARMIPCTACRYCVEGCPMSIQIPEIFSLYNKENTPVKEGDKEEKSNAEVYKEVCEGHGKASECVKCKACEDICPQHIEISSLMGKIAWALE